MPEISTMGFSLQELTIVLIKAAGIHEGHWVVGFAIGANVGTFPFGDGRPGGLPGCLVTVQQAILNRVSTPSPTSVDASIVNPDPAPQIVEATVSEPPRPGSN